MKPSILDTPQGKQAVARAVGYLMQQGGPPQESTMLLLLEYTQCITRQQAREVLRAAYDQKDAPKR